MWTFRLVSESKTVTEARITSVPEITKETTLGMAPGLSATVGAFFSDASYRQTAVKWDAISASQYSGVGKFTVKGTIAGTTLTALANVSVIPVNYALNGGFESGKLAPWTFTGTFWFGSAYAFDMRQKIIGLAPGNYTFSAFVMGDGKPASLRIYSEAGSARKTAAVSLSGWQKWQKFTISGIVVDKSGTVAIGFEGTMTGGDWGKFDDVALNKE